MSSRLCILQLCCIMILLEWILNALAELVNLLWPRDAQYQPGLMRNNNLWCGEFL